MSLSGWKEIFLGPLALAVCCTSAESQVIEPEPCLPSLHGQWAGEWDLSEAINPPPDPQNPDPCTDEAQWAEIAHMVVLPPPNAGRVLFLCRRLKNGPPCTFCDAQAFLWNSSDPSNVELTITLPQAAGGESDPFCSAHTVTSSGQTVFWGGTNLVEDCLDGGGQDPP